MRAVPQGTSRRAESRLDRGAHAHREPRRGGTAARAARLIGAIVAGGANSRFGGEPKGLHLVGGRRIIDRVADALRPETSDLLVISGVPAAAEWLPGVRVVADAWRKQGSLVGIHTALSHARQPIILVAWDMPFITRRLVSLLRERSTGSEFATIPVGPSGLEPFCAVYTPACLPWIEEALAADDLRLSHLLEQLPHIERIPAADLAPIGDPTRLFFNVNDAADLAAAEALAAND